MLDILSIMPCILIHEQRKQSKLVFLFQRLVDVMNEFLSSSLNKVRAYDDARTLVRAKSLVRAKDPCRQ